MLVVQTREGWRCLLHPLHNQMQVKHPNRRQSVIVCFLANWLWINSNKLQCLNSNLLGVEEECIIYNVSSFYFGFDLSGQFIRRHKSFHVVSFLVLSSLYHLRQDRYLSINCSLSWLSASKCWRLLWNLPWRKNIWLCLVNYNVKLLT